jgi:ribulose-5-phosphate 4-epimerase/fuculose-1-phosphate aldolase
MNYAFAGRPTSTQFEEFARELGGALEARGFERANVDAREADLVLNLIDPTDPKPFRRRSRGTFVAAIHEQQDVPDDVLKTNYPLLVRALANIVLCYVPGEGVWFTTMERGHYGVDAENGQRELAEGVIERLAPLALSKLVIDNEFRTDLEPELWKGDGVTREISEAGKRMGDLDLLPAPFPIEELLDEQDLRHVKRLYGIGGLSYGNLSQRKDGRRFWMSASGVDKTRLEIPGRDILLVSGYDPDRNTMILSVPPDAEPRRVSVDAIEHWMIYRAHPDVGAILHVHAWMQEIPATDINYPCGTEELATSVAELIDREPDPGHAVIGLRNHGITATGKTLTEILDRIQPRVLRQVPMS